MDSARLYALRPACVRAHLRPTDALLPLSPGVLLPVMGAPLVEVPALHACVLDAALQAANALNAPLCVALDGEAGKEVSGPRGFHGAVAFALQAARDAGFRLPLVLHARLGMVDGDDDQSVDLARIKLLEAVDAGVTSVQMGVFGDADRAALLLRDILSPAADNGLGVVVQLADSHQAAELPGLLGALEVHAWAGAVSPPLLRREAVPLKGATPGGSWLDASAVVSAAARAALGTQDDLAASLRAASKPVWNKVEFRVHAAVEELLKAVHAKDSADHAMLALSNARESWPEPV